MSNHPINGIYVQATPCGSGTIRLQVEQHNPFGGGSTLTLYASLDDLRALSDYLSITADQIEQEQHA